MTYKPKPSKARKVLVGIWLLLILGGLLFLHQSGKSPLEFGDQLGRFFQQSHWAPVLFVAVFTLRTIFFFSSAVFALLAGALFGGWEGSLILGVGAVTSALLAHQIGSYFPPSLFKSFDKVQEHLEKRGTSHFKLCLVLHLLHVPYDVVNLLAGSLGLDRRQLIKSLLGSIPGFLTFVFLGASSGLAEGNLDFNPTSVAWSVFFLICGIALADKIE